MTSLICPFNPHQWWWRAEGTYRWWVWFLPAASPDHRSKTGRIFAQPSSRTPDPVAWRRGRWNGSHCTPPRWGTWGSSGRFPPGGGHTKSTVISRNKKVICLQKILSEKQSFMWLKTQQTSIVLHIKQWLQNAMKAPMKDWPLLHEGPTLSQRPLWGNNTLPILM